MLFLFFFFFQAEDGIRDVAVTGVQTCALPILLHKANLRGADLSLADLRGAWLIQADLREANVLGTELREANLQGANLEHARGLWVGRLGGTNLFGAVLPEPISALIRPQVVRQATKRAAWVFVAMLLVNLLTCFIIARTTDVRLFKNSPALPLPLLGDAVPLVGFYLGAPLLLFAFYISFHFFLLRSEEHTSELQSRLHLVCRLLLEKKKKKIKI